MKFEMAENSGRRVKVNKSYGNFGCGPWYTPEIGPCHGMGYAELAASYAESFAAMQSLLRAIQYV